MGVRRLLRTNAFRLTLLNVVLFGLVVAIALASVFFSFRNHIYELVDTRLRLETDVLINLYQTGAMPQLMNAIKERSEIDDYGRIYYLSKNSPVSDQGFQSTENAVLGIGTQRVFKTMRMGEVNGVPVDSPRTDVPVRVAETQLSNGVVLLIGHEITHERDLISHALWLLGVTFVVTLGVALGGGAWMGFSILKRIDGINRTARRFMKGDFSQRIALAQFKHSDEFEELSQQLNLMLTKIEDLMNSMRQVTNNIAHDLRSPLTRIRNRLEVTLMEDREPEEYREVMAGAIGDADHLINTFNALLSISRMETGLDRSGWKLVDLAYLAEESGELYQPAAEDQQQTLVLKILGRPKIMGNRHQLAQAMSNLLDNAIKYSPKGGQLELYVGEDKEYGILRVADSGPGIPLADRERVLQRFVRLETERKSVGNGLGLSLVQAIVQLHDAELLLSDNQPGLIVEIRLPKHRAHE